MPFEEKYRIVEKIRSGSYGTVYKCSLLQQHRRRRKDHQDDARATGDGDGEPRRYCAGDEGDGYGGADDMEIDAIEEGDETSDGDGDAISSVTPPHVGPETSGDGWMPAGDAATASAAAAPGNDAAYCDGRASSHSDTCCDENYAVKVIDRTKLTSKRRKRRRRHDESGRLTLHNDEQQQQGDDVDEVEEEEEDLAPFLREVSVMRELRGVPNVVQLIDYYADHPFKLHLVMTLARGGDLLGQLASQSTYHEGQARALIKVLLETLGHLHSRNVVHRDVKPENLLLQHRTIGKSDDNDDNKGNSSSSQQLLLADFGFARKIGAGNSLGGDDSDADGLCHTLCGTPAFAAPEILVGRPYGASCDLWSAGCVAYVLLSGRYPFYASSASRNHRELFRKIRAGDYVFHQKHFASVSTSAKRFVSRLLTVNVRHRYTAQQALDESDWFQASADALLRHNRHDLTSSLVGIRKFQADRRWRSTAGALRWASTAPFWNSDRVSFHQQLKAWDQQALQQMVHAAIAGAPSSPGPRLPPEQQQQQEERLPPPSAFQSAPTLGKVTESMLAKLPTLRFDDVYRRVRHLRNPSRTGSTSVWECRHVAPPHEAFDVKIVDRAQLHPADDEAVLNEVAILQALSSNRHVVQLLDFYEEDDAFYLVMEKVDGGDVFDQILQRQAYTEEDARGLIARLLRAVKGLHDVSICHRDLKPQNLLLMSSDDCTKIKVADFAFARRVHVPQSLTSRVGTPTYVAPEILKNVPHDERVDLWSVGIIAYVLLCGYPPFLEDNQQLLFEKIRSGSYQFHDPDWRTVSREAKSFIQGLLRVDPCDRWSADEALKSRWMEVPAWRLSSNQLSDSLRNLKEKKMNLRLLARAFLWTTGGAVGAGGSGNSSHPTTTSGGGGNEDSLGAAGHELRDVLASAHDKVVASAQGTAEAVVQAASETARGVAHTVRTKVLLPPQAHDGSPRDP
jgi:serine/threonine protein kinase